MFELCIFEDKENRSLENLFNDKKLKTSLTWRNRNIHVQEVRRTQINMIRRSTYHDHYSYRTGRRKAKDIFKVTVLDNNSYFNRNWRGQKEMRGFFHVLKEICKPRIFCPEIKKSSANEEIMTLQDTWKLREFITTRPHWNKILKGVL